MVEADKPLLSACYPIMQQLKSHTENWVTDKRKRADGTRLTATTMQTFNLRYNARGGSERAPLMQAAFVAGYLLDPYYAVWDADAETYLAPQVPDDLLKDACALVRRVGGAKAESKLRELTLVGYPKEQVPWVQMLADKRLAVEAHAQEQAKQVVGQKRPRSDPAREVLSAFARYSAWKKMQAAAGLADLAPVAKRLLAGHATSASAERNWSLFGRVLVSARSSLGEERAKQLIAICAAEQAMNYASDDVAMVLDILEGTVEAEEAEEPDISVE